MRRRQVDRPEFTGGELTITRGLINLCWFFFKWGTLLALLGGVLAVPYFYRRVDEELRQQIEARFAAHYPHLIARVRFAQLIEGEGIEIRGLSLVERGAAGPQAELAFLDEIFLSGPITLQDLVAGNPKVTHVKVRRPAVRATRRPDGTWSAAKLLPLPKFSESRPKSTIENGTLEVFDPLKNPSSTFTVRDINLTVEPIPASDAPESEQFSVDGYLAADQVQRVEFKGTLDAKAQSFALGGTVAGLDLSPELRAALPLEVAERLAVLGSLRGEVKLDFRLLREPDQVEPLRFDVSGQLARGRYDDPRLPYLLSELRARFHLDNEGFAVSDLQARSGQSTLRLSGRRNGYDAGSPCMIEVHASRLQLDQQVLKVLTDSLRAEWYKYLPEGEVDADLKFAYDGIRWQPELEIRCLNVSFTCHKFPYRLERGTGTLALKDDRFTAHLTAYAGGQPVRLNADILHPGPRCTGSIDAEGDCIPFDENLFAALNDSARPVVRSLNPRGTFNFFARQWRDDPNRPAFRTHLLIGLNRCAMNYDKFPYPLNNIRGTLEMFDGAWTFRELEGTNDTGFVTCKGRMAPVAEGQQLALFFTGDNVPLEEELRDALPAGAGRLWNALKPRGSVDLLVDLGYLSSSKTTSIKLRARPRPETSSIEPVAFPYRLEKLRGTIHYQDGHAELENVEAVHGRTEMSTGGSCDLAADGGWRLRLKNLAVDRIRVDHELVSALPEGLRKVVAELKPSGAINARGSLELAKSGAADALLQSNWDVAFDLHQAAIEAGLKFENLYGGVKMAGGFDGRQFQSQGELALDSATYKNFQFTEIAGPLWIDNQHALFGGWADARVASKAGRRISAKIFGGTIEGDCQVTLGPAAEYTLRAALADADLAQFAKENISGRQKLNGKVAANVDLQGTPKGPHTLRGGGSVRLRDADIYELPVMVAMLKILSVRQPDTSAFTKSDIDFRVQGEHVLLDRVNFSGDAVSLLGQGQLNFDRQLNLTFHAVVGREEFQVPILRGMLGEASQQIMQIRVDGTIDHPNMRREAFPGVSQALQQLQAELQMPGQAPKTARNENPSTPNVSTRK